MNLYLEGIRDGKAKGAVTKTSVDGATRITNLGKTPANKQLERCFIRDVLIGGNPAKIDNYLAGERCIPGSRVGQQR